MAYGRLRTPAPIMAVTVWKVEYHHLARRVVSASSFHLLSERASSCQVLQIGRLHKTNREKIEKKKKTVLSLFSVCLTNQRL